MVSQVLFDRACADLKHAAAENERLRDELAGKESERFALKSELCHLRKEYAHIDGTACALAKENKRLRRVCADAARKISNDVRDLGPCGRAALTDVYIILHEALRLPKGGE